MISRDWLPDKCEIQSSVAKIIEASRSYGLDETFCNFFLGQLQNGNLTQQYEVQPSAV